MARPKIKEEIKEEFNSYLIQNEFDLQHLWNEKIQDIVNKFEDRLATLEKKLEKPEGKSINKVEKFNDEIPTSIEGYNGMKMEASDKIQSMINAIRILPPNMVVNGRHLKENVEAICGFKVLDEMMDEAYEVVNNDPRGN